MAHRRPHNKSRYGCDQCRKRRVKCDEQPPRCSNCIAREETCHFSRVTPSHGGLRTPQPTPSPNSTITRSEPVPRNDNLWQSPSIRKIELQLMHQWCCYTYASVGSQWRRLFQEYVTKEALKNDYLMASVLALSSFHLATETLGDETTAREHTSIGLEYQNQALAGLRNAMETMPPDESSPILFTSILVAACAIISPLLPAGPGDVTRPATEAFLPWVYHSKTIESIKLATMPHLKDTSIGQYVDMTWQCAELERPLCVGKLRQLNRDLTSSPVRYAMYEKAISEIEISSRKEDAIPLWLVEAGKEFMDELQALDGIALAIYMQWGVLLDQLHDVWWAKFSGRRLVEELSVTLRERGPVWTQVTIWCREQVELSLTTNRDG